MDLDEALKIMNFEAGDKITDEILTERYWDFIERNGEEKEGSAYLRAKVSNAKDSLCAEFGLNVEEKPIVEEEGEGEGVDEKVMEEEVPKDEAKEGNGGEK